MLLTRAERDRDGWIINGRKWFITGAEGAAFTICMTMTDEGPSMLIIDAENPGWRVERVIGATDRVFAGGHAEILFEDCRVGEDALLGEVGEGLRHAQVRLAPARLTHCMRWLGAARRALDIALTMPPSARRSATVSASSASTARCRSVVRSGCPRTPRLARLISEVRPFRIYDGPTETHLWAIARRALRDRTEQVSAGALR